MAYVQKSVPPPNNILNFSLKDFSGGMNNRSDQINDNEGAQVINLMFADDTILETRYGQKYYDEVDVTDPIIYLDEYKPYNEPNVLIRATIDTMYFGDVAIPIFGKPCGVNYMGRYYFSDGVKLRVFAKYHIVGNVDSTHQKYVGTALEGYQVYDVVSPVIGHAMLDATYTNGVTSINYTTKTVYYEPCIKEFEDEYKGANVLPSNVKYLVSHTGRIFASGNKDDDDNVFISDLQNPLYFAVGLPLQIPPSSDKIKGMCVFDNSVLVGRELDIYVIIGDTNILASVGELFKLKRLNTHTGFASNTAIDIAHNYLIFLGSDGNVYAIQNARANERDLSSIILSRSIDLFKEPISLGRDDLEGACSYFHNDEWYLSMGNKTMVYNYRMMSWVMYEGLNARSYYDMDGEWIWGRPDGRIAMFDTVNFFDFGEPYQSLWYSKIFDMDDANSFKQFREFFLVAHTFALQYSDIYVTFEIDYASINERAIISNQISRWGISVFGDRYIVKNINESLPFVIGRRGRNIRIKVTNGYPLDGTVDEYIDLENYPAKREGLLVKVNPDSYYLYVDRVWTLLDYAALNQRMKLYQINGDYEMRGKR